MTRPSGGAATAETMRQLRVAIRRAIRTLTLEEAAARGGVHMNTIKRLLHGGNISIRTAARIVEGLGGCLEIRLGK